MEKVSSRSEKNQKPETEKAKPRQPVSTRGEQAPGASPPENSAVNNPMPPRQGGTDAQELAPKTGDDTENREPLLPASQGSRRLRASLLTAAALLVGWGGFLLSRKFFAVHSSISAPNPEIPVPSTAEEATTTEIALHLHPLTGLPLPASPDQGGPVTPTTTRPFAVSIDNAPEARPQWGLSKADIVINSLVEGGITRIVAVFSSQKANKIGPVRSARPYFLWQAQNLNALFVHSGGSAEALAVLNKGVEGVADLNEFANGQYFWRTNTPAPHNLFTSSEQLEEAAEKRSYSLEFTAAQPWQFSTSTPATLPTTTEITVPYAMQSMRARYVFNPAARTYDRFNDGMAHRDAANGTQLSPANVVFEFHALVDIADPHRYGLVNFSYEGTGAFIALTQGKRIEGTWSRQKNGPATYAVATGGPLTLSPGQTFIEIIPSPMRGQMLNTLR